MTTSPAGRSSQFVDDDGHGARQLLAQAQEELLADELGGQEPLGAIGERVGIVQRRARRQHGQQLAHQIVDAHAPGGRDRHQRGEGSPLRTSSAAGGQQLLLVAHPIDLVERDDDGPARAWHSASRRPRAVRLPALARWRSGLRPPAGWRRRRLSAASASCTMNRPSAERGSCTPGVSTKTIWPPRPSGELAGPDAHDAVAGRLRARGDDGQLLAQDAVEQGRLADVGRARDRDRARPIAARRWRRASLAGALGAECEERFFGIGRAFIARRHAGAPWRLPASASTAPKKSVSSALSLTATRPDVHANARGAAQSTHRCARLPGDALSSRSLAGCRGSAQEPAPPGAFSLLCGGGGRRHRRDLFARSRRAPAGGRRRRWPPSPAGRR